MFIPFTLLELTLSARFARWAKKTYTLGVGLILKKSRKHYLSFLRETAPIPIRANPKNATVDGAETDVMLPSPVVE